MKITEKDKKLFEYLRNSEMNKDLLDYLERLQDYMCDLRNWKGKKFEEVRAIMNASEFIKVYLEDKVKYTNKKKDSITSFE